jgi:hypothetical protein
MAVHPRRQFWISYSPPWELEISCLLCCAQLSSRYNFSLTRGVRKVMYGGLLWRPLYSDWSTQFCDVKRHYRTTFLRYFHHCYQSVSVAFPIEARLLGHAAASECTTPVLFKRPPAGPFSRLKYFPDHIPSLELVMKAQNRNDCPDIMHPFYTK